MLTHGTPRFSSERLVRHPESHSLHVVEPAYPPDVLFQSHALNPLTKWHLLLSWHKQ